MGNPRQLPSNDDCRPHRRICEQIDDLTIVSKTSTAVSNRMRVDAAYHCFGTFKIERSLAVCLALALTWSLPLYAREKYELPSDISSAKSIAILVRLVGRDHTFEDEDARRSAAEKEIQKRGRFQIVQDPDKADLVCMIVDSDLPVSHARWFDSNRLSLDYTTLLIFRGGASTAWSSVPIWLDTLAHAGRSFSSWHINSLLSDFHQDVHDADERTTRSSRAGERVKSDAAAIADPDTIPHGWRPDLDRAASAILAARSVTLLCREHRGKFLSSGRNYCQQADVEKIINEGARWNVVNDSAKADLLFVWSAVFENYHPEYDGTVTYIYRWAYSELLVFKVTSKPEWRSMPLYYDVGNYPFPLFRDLQQRTTLADPWRNAFGQDNPPQRSTASTPVVSSSARSNADFASGSSNHVLAGLSVDAYTQIILREPGNADAFNERGKVYRAMGAFDHAISDFTEAIRIRPFFVDARDNLEEAKHAKAKSACAFQIVCK